MWSVRAKCFSAYAFAAFHIQRVWALIWNSQYPFESVPVAMTVSGDPG
jgi:hypothetical protein